MQEAFRVLAQLRNKPMVAAFVHFNVKTLGYRVTVADCSKALWRETAHDLAKMARCAGVYRLPVSAAGWPQPWPPWQARRVSSQGWPPAS